MDNPWATEWPAADWLQEEQDITAHRSLFVSDHPSTPPPETTDPSLWTAWEAVRQEQEHPDRAVPPELLDSLLRHCQQVSQEAWPASETGDEGNWRSGFDSHADVAALLAQLLPTDPTLPPAAQFSATATAKAMNEALKGTRHLPTSATSPLSRLLASKGSLDWEKSVRAKQDVVQDVAHVGWKVLEKEDRHGTPEESKQRKVTGGLLSFWNRRTTETQSERSTSPAGQEGVQSAPHPPSSRAASPSKAPVTSVAPPPPADSQATVAAPSTVSRFLNRFSRVKGTQHSALALSADDLEFLSDIVPSATDPPDEDTPLDALTGTTHPTLLPPTLPPPIPPPPKRPSRPPSAFGLDSPDSLSIESVPTAFQMNGTPNVPILPPPLSSKPIAPLSRAQSPIVAPGQSGSPSIQHMSQPNSRPNSRPQSSFTIPPPQTAPLLLSIPPLLPPPPVSPPQTPRPTTVSSTMRSTNTSSYHDSYDSDDEFSEFTSFPPSAPTPFPSLEPYPSRGPPSPPSPPPRRLYERTHYPSSSSASSMLSPTSQSSLDQLYPTRSSISTSLDGFDDFVSPSSRGENKKRTPSPPPLPVKPQQQRLDTSAPRVYHAHTPSQTLASPTVHTSLMNGPPLAPSVSPAEHRRTQTLVNHAAARGGLLWPNSPDMDEPKVAAIPPPPSASSSPKSLLGQEGFDLLGDGDAFAGILETLPPRRVAEKVSGVLLPSTDADKGLGLRPSSPRVPSTSAATLSFSALGTSGPVAAMNSGSPQPAKPKQTGGLSAQDLSFFEGL